MASNSPVRLRCEHLTNPVGVDAVRPRLSWIMPVTPGAREERQSAYQILVASSAELLARDSGDLWDSGKVVSDQSVLVDYAGRALKSGEVCHWKVRIWDGNDRPADWSEPARWRMGVLRAEDWKAEWIGFPEAALGEENVTPCPWFRKTFDLETVPRDAVAFVGSIGFHELYINGRKVGDGVLTPSVSNLRKRALYLTHEIAPYLKPGRNAVAIWLAPGWTQFRDGCPEVDFGRKGKPLLIAQFQLGAGAAPIVTDATWRCAPSNTWHLGRWQNSDFGGDRVDARRDEPGWNEAGFDDRGWQRAVVAEPEIELSSDLIEPNRMCEKFEATGLAETSPGAWQFSFAKLFTGWIEMKIAGEPGTKITLTLSTLADREIECGQCNEYIIGPAGSGVFRNRFSYHEVRCVTVRGLAKAPQLHDVAGYRVTNDRARAGDFDCSNRLLKKIYDVTAYNYIGLSTGGMTVDCPHRERLGYGGDGHTTMELALDAFASAAFLTKWARDWCDVQDEDGRIHHTAPTYGGGGGPGWSGFILTLPWEVYLAQGDTRILETTFPFAEKWLAYLARSVGADGLLGPLSEGKWKYPNGQQWLFLGDWLAPRFCDESLSTEAVLFNNCYYLYVLRIAARVAGLLGKGAEGKRYAEIAAKLKEAIHRRFWNVESGGYLDNAQTRLVLPLVAGAVPEAHVGTVEKILEDDILVTRQGHLDTGMHGTWFMTKYLAERDRSDLVFTYATQTTYPSWGYLLGLGCETWPEEWRGNESQMHGCMNGIGGWFQRGLAGIRGDADAPGYKRIVIRPALVGDLTWVKAHHDSPYGRITCEWRREGESLAVEVGIPANATATVYLPVAKGAWEESGKAVGDFREEEGRKVVVVGAGRYAFRAG